MTNTIVLIHGAWLNALSWEKVKARYEAQGYNVIAADWPFDNRSPAQASALPRPPNSPPSARTRSSSTTKPSSALFRKSRSRSVTARRCLRAASAVPRARCCRRRHQPRPNPRRAAWPQCDRFGPAGLFRSLLVEEGQGDEPRLLSPAASPRPRISPMSTPIMIATSSSTPGRVDWNGVVNPDQDRLGQAEPCPPAPPDRVVARRPHR